MSIIGARMRTPATSVSNARSYSPAKCDTSVEVPPMSKPMSRAKPASRPVSAMPTTPAAGPERIASLPRNSSAAVNPPEDIMNIRRVRFSPPPCGEGSEVGVGEVLRKRSASGAPPPDPPPSTLPHKGGGNELLRDLRHVAAQDRREIGVDHGGIAATNELDERRDFMARRHLREAELARERRDAPLVIGVAVGVHENDGDGARCRRACARSSAARAAARSSSRSTVPSARTRSSTSTTRS